MDTRHNFKKKQFLCKCEAELQNGPNIVFGKHLICSKMQLHISDVIACMFVCVMYHMTFPSSCSFFS